MSDHGEQVAEIVAADISAAIDSANDRADERADIADAVIDGAMETARGQEIRQLREELDECMSNQSALTETLVVMTAQLSEIQARLTPPEPPPLTVLPVASEAAVDGLKDAQENLPDPAVMASPAEADQAIVEVPEPVRKPKKKRRWI